MVKEDKKEELSQKTVFAYERMFNYFLTVFFVFFLMIFLLLIVGLSREVLADKEIEQHVLKTRNLFNELEAVEENSKSYDNLSLNMSDYIPNSVIERLNLLDFSEFSSERTNVSYLTLRSKHKILSTEGGTIAIRDLNPRINDRVLVTINSRLVDGIVIDIKKSGNLIILCDNNFDGIGEIKEVDLGYYNGVVLYKNEIRN